MNENGESLTIGETAGVPFTKSTIVKPPRDMKSLEIAIYASLWTAFSMALSATIMAVLLINILPSHSEIVQPLAPVAPERPAPDLKIDYQVKAIKIPIMFETQSPRSVTIPLETKIAPPRRVVLPIEMKVVIDRTRAEAVKVSSKKEPPPAVNKKLKTMSPVWNQKTGIGIPPKEGDIVPPPKTLKRRKNVQAQKEKK